MWRVALSHAHHRGVPKKRQVARIMLKTLTEEMGKQIAREHTKENTMSKRTIAYIKVNVTMRSRMRESRTYGSVRG